MPDLTEPKREYKIDSANWWTMSMPINHNLEDLERCNSMVEDFCRALAERGVKLSALEIAKIVAHEATTNAQKYGEGHLKIGLKYDEIRKAIKLIVHDEGNGFDLSKVPDPTAEGLLTEGGRGIAMMRLYTHDGLRYQDHGRTMEARVDCS